MNRQQKELVVQLFKERFTQSAASFVVGYRGMTVNQLHDLRTKLRTSGGH
jgi:ribosomal protein L10